MPLRATAVRLPAEAAGVHLGIKVHNIGWQTWDCGLSAGSLRVYDTSFHIIRVHAKIR